jgi:hypothetical protein
MGASLVLVEGASGAAPMAYQDAAHGVIEVREHDSAASPSAPDRPLRMADLMDRVLGGLGDRRCLHHDALDEHSRQVYLEVLADERKKAASTLCTRANSFLAAYASPSCHC